MPGRAFIAAALASVATAAGAGGVDLSGQPLDIIFAEGDQARLSFGMVAPDVSGRQIMPVGPAPVGARSGDMTGDQFPVSAAYKRRLTDDLHAAIILDQPFGAKVDYPTGTGYFAQGTTAELDTEAVTLLARYVTDGNFSVFGGLRYQRLSAEAFIPFVTDTNPALPAPGAPYSARGAADGGWGYVAGVGYEVPEIALRVTLAYNSSITHELGTRETSVLGSDSSVSEVDAPQSVNLSFQTGIAPDTLLFAGARWVDWTGFDISPRIYEGLTGGTSLVAYAEDRVTYSLGVGRQLTDAFSAAVTLAYEPEQDIVMDNLGPVDGLMSVSLGGSYAFENLTVSGGVTYARIGHALARGPEGAAARFADNDAVGVGLELGYSF